MLCRISQYSRARRTGGVLPSPFPISSARRWHFLYFLPLPDQHGALRGGLFCGMPRSVFSVTRRVVMGSGAKTPLHSRISPPHRSNPIHPVTVSTMDSAEAPECVLELAVPSRDA